MSESTVPYFLSFKLGSFYKTLKEYSNNEIANC